MVTIFRELSYPQPILFSHPWIAWTSPPPAGQSLSILIYCAIITLFLTIDSIIQDAYYFERIAFRAAWVSVTQVPLIFLLAGKINIAGFLLGASSYMDVNWMHRWVSRTLLVTVTIHGAFFIREWVRADFFSLELEMMPMVKYGLGMWGVLAWMNISSLLPLRRLCYEFFVLQHIVSNAVFLWLLHTHVPAYAAYNVWMAVAFVLLNRVSRFSVFLYRNVSFWKRDGGQPRRRPVGFSAELRDLAGETTMVTISKVGFSWKPGQHIFLSCPAIAPLESHPFTISNLPEEGHQNGLSRIELVIRARSGFTRRLLQRARSAHIRSRATTVFVSGPFGKLPAWNTCENLVLISASTGASFTLSILKAVLKDPCCVRNIRCIVLVRHAAHVEGYLPRLLAAASCTKASEVKLQINIAVTSKDTSAGAKNAATVELRTPSSSSSSNGVSNTLLKTQRQSTEKGDFGNGTIRTQSVTKSIAEEEATVGITDKEECSNCHTRRGNTMYYSFGRPNLGDSIRDTVETSTGETSIVVCGGRSLSSTVRNCVASLSDERAVHKGTGAQGIHLHVEGFGS